MSKKGVRLTDMISFFFKRPLGHRPLQTVHKLKPERSDKSHLPNEISYNLDFVGPQGGALQ